MTIETWNGGTGNWNDATQWTPQQVPRPGDTARLLGGTVQIIGVDASNIPILDGWSLPALDQDATLDITNSIIGNVSLEGGNPVTPHGAAHAVFNLQGLVVFRGTMGIDNAGEGATLNVTMASDSALVNQGQWQLDQEGQATVNIAMAPGDLIINQGGIYAGSGMGSLTISGDASDWLVNDGTIAAGSEMVIGPTVVGNGTFEVAPQGAYLGTNVGAEFKGFVAAGETFAFGPQLSIEDLTLDHAREFLGTIANFAQGDTIEMPGVTATASQYQDGTLTLYNAHAPVAALHFAGSYDTSDFAFSTSNGATIITHSG
jgi:hypothetical protein